MQTTVDASDGDLARAVAARGPGSAEAAESELYRRFAPRVRLYGRRHLRDEEAARDLGASATQSFRLALLPLLWPAIFASAVVVFATSIDDFVISSFLSTDASNETVPMKIYSSARAASTPRS